MKHKFSFLILGILFLITTVAVAEQQQFMAKNIIISQVKAEIHKGKPDTANVYMRIYNKGLIDTLESVSSPDADETNLVEDSKSTYTYASRFRIPTDESIYLRSDRSYIVLKGLHNKDLQVNDTIALDFDFVHNQQVRVKATVTKVIK